MMGDAYSQNQKDLKTYYAQVSRWAMPSGRGAPSIGTI
jgi:hypothetical protein